MRPLPFLLLPAALALASAGHAGSFTPPAGCTGWMTVQARACRVSNYYKCEGDAPGDQWRADFDQEGLFFASKIDRQTQWVLSIDMSPMVRQTLDPGAADPASFDALLAGRDDFDFHLSRDDGTRSHVTGHDALTGRSVTIDDVALQETEFSFRETDEAGTLLRQSRGHEYISAEWRTFFSGPSEWDDGSGGGYLPLDGSPVEFIFPGEPGYMSTQPVFECDAVLSGAPGGGSLAEGGPAEGSLVARVAAHLRSGAGR